MKNPLLRAAIVVASALLGVGAVATSAQATGNTDKPCVAANFTADNFVFANGGATATFALRPYANCAPNGRSSVLSAPGSWPWSALPWSPRRWGR